MMNIYIIKKRFKIYCISFNDIIVLVTLMLLDNAYKYSLINVYDIHVGNSDYVTF